jgi:hypothetical protein
VVEATGGLVEVVALVGAGELGERKHACATDAAGVAAGRHS